LRFTVADLGGVGITDDFSVEKEDFIIRLLHAETKSDEFPLADSWSTITFPRLDTMKSKYRHYYTVGFEGLNNASKSAAVYRIDSSGNETAIADPNFSGTTSFASSAVGAKLGNLGSGVYLFTAVVLTLFD
jgi:hypothetical protein